MAKKKSELRSTTDHSKRRRYFHSHTPDPITGFALKNFFKEIDEPVSDQEAKMFKDLTNDGKEEN